jgi:hypothetical protein
LVAIPDFIGSIKVSAFPGAGVFVINIACSRDVHREEWCNQPEEISGDVDGL